MHQTSGEQWLFEKHILYNRVPNKIYFMKYAIFNIIFFCFRVSQIPSNLFSMLSQVQMLSDIHWNQNIKPIRAFKKPTKFAKIGKNKIFGLSLLYLDCLIFSFWAA